jgi:heterodisulfide reductase subunit B
MKYALFLGCTIPARAMNYEISTRKMAEKLGIEFVDLPDFSCCGLPIKSLDFMTSIVMAAKNVAVAEEKGLDICVLCNGCAVTLVEANHLLKHDKEMKKKVNEHLAKIGKEFKGTVEVKHLARILYEDFGADKIRELVKYPLEDFKFAAHYGCHYFKPSVAYESFDNPEFPVSLDELIQATGAPPVEYTTKTACCGGGLLAISQDIALKLTKEKLDELHAMKTDALVSICPFCSVMYDANQKSVEKDFEGDYDLPVFYYPQLLGLALGIPSKDLEFKRNRIKPKDIIEKFEKKYSLAEKKE